ncbi:MAG: hypothetical protein M0Z25_03645 [Nitrospiraceae bacterium]|jgi:hypothetical protein|nr:hypothetical protein [Nitrospiraceae bacterium]MDA8113010.1 hypothetical protein [Nitrospiraceae bacterium]
MGASSTGSWNAMDYIVIGGVLLAFVIGGAAMIRAIRAANRINPK